MQANAEFQPAPLTKRKISDRIDLVSHLLRGLSPGEIGVGMAGPYFLPCNGGPAKPKGWVRVLHTAMDNITVINLEKVAIKIGSISLNNLSPDGQELIRDPIAFIVAQVETIASIFDWVATGDNINQKATIT
jgi:hypothetical protein